MASIISTEETIPILTASGNISVNTASSCELTCAAGISKMSKTPVVFWEVTEVIALMPYTPSAEKVFRSA